MTAEVINTTQENSSSHLGGTTESIEGGHELAQRLVRLCQLDIDAVYAYERAADAIDDEHHDIYNALLRFRDDHVEHVLGLTNAICGFGGEAPSIGRDLKGMVIEGMTALRSVTGTVGALKAMNLNETLTNHIYEEALAWEMPDSLRELIEHYRADEARHKEFIERSLQKLGVSPEEWARFNESENEDEETSHEKHGGHPAH